jgi:hypothetical protein
LRPPRARPARNEFCLRSSGAKLSGAICTPPARPHAAPRQPNCSKLHPTSQARPYTADQTRPKQRQARREVLTVTRRHGTCESPLGRHWQGRLAAFASGDGVPAMRTQAADRRPPPRLARGRGGARAHATSVHPSTEAAIQMAVVHGLLSWTPSFHLGGSPCGTLVCGREEREPSDRDSFFSEY